MDWTSEGWRAEALEWAAAAGCVVSGEVEQWVRPWATTLRLPTNDGLVWLKAAGSGTASEMPLMRLMTDLALPHLLRPLAIDVERDWMLVPDGGPTLRMALDRHADLGEWERLLPKYAQLQRALEGIVLPLSDHSPALMPTILATLLAALPVGRRAELEALRPRYQAWCEELSDSGIAPTVQHDDLHDGNVFANHVIFDWGDAVFAHPFASLLVTLRSVARRFSLEPGGPELSRLRDCYLEAWTDTHSRLELEYLALLATRVGKVSRSAGWLRALEGAEPGEHAEAAPGWLEELLEVDVF